MRTWIRSEGDLQSTRLPGSTSFTSNGHCSGSAVAAAAAAVSSNHTNTCEVYTSSAHPDHSADHLFSFALQEERNHYSQSFYPGMNESDVGDDELASSLPHVHVSHATTSTSNVTSTVTTSSVTSSSCSTSAATSTTVGSFITKPMYHLPLSTPHESSVTMKQSVTDTVNATVSSQPSFQLIEDVNQQPSPCDSINESQSNNSSPFMNVTNSFPASTDHGFPDEFFTALRDLFAVLDDSKRGSVKVADIEKRWVDDDSTVFSPKGLTDCLRKVSTCNGTVDFDRFCAAIKICLLKNQTLLAKPESVKVQEGDREEGEDEEQEEEEDEQEAEREEEQAEARHKDDEEEDKDDYERHALPHTVNQQVPSSPSEVTFVRGGSVNSNCTLPAAAPYHHTKVNSSLDAAAASVGSRSHNAQVTSKIYANSSYIQHPSSLLHGHHQQQQQQQHQQQQPRKLSSADEQLVPCANGLVFGGSDQSNGHHVFNSTLQNDCANNREQLTRPDPLAYASFHNRFIGTTASNVYEHQYSHQHQQQHHHHHHQQQQQHPHSPSSMVNQFFPQRKSSSNVHPNTRNHIISPCEVPLPPNSTASVNRVPKMTGSHSTTAPILAKPPHAYSILRRIASETAASSSSSSAGTSNGRHNSTGPADGKSKMNHKNIHTNHLVDTSPLPANKCSTVPRTKDRKFKANNLIQMFKNFKLNSVLERTIHSSKQHSNESNGLTNCNGLSRVDSKQSRSKSKDDENSTVRKVTKSEVSSDSSFSGSGSGLHHQQVPLPPPPGAPSSHASSSVDFMEAYPLPHLASSNSDSYIPHPPNVINSYGMIPPPVLDEGGDEDLPLHFQSSRTQMMRRKRDRRHTVSHGIDYNHIKKMQILQHEKDILLRGLQAVERAKDWYLKQMADVTDKIRSAGRTFAPVPSESCQVANERLQFRANRIIAANAHLIALMDEANFPIHMNLAFKPLLVPHSTDPIINLNVSASSCLPVSSSFSSSQVRGECGQVKGLISPPPPPSSSTDDKNGHLSQLESEKAAFLQMFHSTATTNSSSPSRKRSTSDCPFV